MRLLKTLIVFMALALSMPFAWADKININTADQETLDVALDGIGPKKAQAIIDYRNEHGAFKTIDDITNVSGIGPKTLEKNRHKITVGTEPAASTEKSENPASTEKPKSEQAATTDSDKADAKNTDKATSTEDTDKAESPQPAS